MASTQSLGEMVILYTGPLFFGTIFNWAFFGIVALQTYIYFSNRPKDSAWIKGLVAATITIDTVQTIFATHFVWHMVIVNWGNPATLESPPWTSYPVPILSGVVAGLVQIFCAWRISLLSKTVVARCVAVFVALVAVMQGVAAIVTGVQWRVLGVARASQIKSSPTIWLAGSVICDVIIALAMSYLLYKAKTPDMFSRTNNLVDRLIRQVVQSGAITAVMATVELVLFLVAPENYLHITLAIFLGKLYSNVLLANLNSRRSHTGVYETNPSTTLGSNNVHIHTFRHVEADVEMKTRSEGDFRKV